ncbi:HTH-type transcriptional repressor NsrR [Rhizobiaceae bacterium]|nr:HTH-type transcriptional repressor NsrR [Rhizobiaceae bacterium]
MKGHNLGILSVRLTKFSDYALRALIFAASTDRLATIEETADIYGISRAHLKKVVMILTHQGFLKGVRGRLGGYTLGRPPQEINLGAVLRATEADFQLVECFGPDNRCRISRTCRLAGIANEALAAFVSTFDRYTLADVLVRHDHLLSPATDVQPARGPYLPTTGAPA